MEILKELWCKNYAEGEKKTEHMILCVFTMIYFRW